MKKKRTIITKENRKTIEPNVTFTMNWYYHTNNVTESFLFYTSTIHKSSIMF